MYENHYSHFPLLDETPLLLPPNTECKLAKLFFGASFTVDPVEVDLVGFIELTDDPDPPRDVPIEFWDSSLEYSARRARLKEEFLRNESESEWEWE